MKCTSPRFACLLLAASTLAGCTTARPLMPTPAIYGEPGGVDPFADTPAERRRTGVDLLFVTDRSPEDPAERRAANDAPGGETVEPYGEDRSRQIIFGSAVVEMVPALDWGALERQSRLGERTVPVNLELGPVREVGRFPVEPYRLEADAQGLRRSAESVRLHGEARAALQAEIGRRLALSSTRRVVLYVHGFNETFSTAAYTAAELCHFLGRKDVCAFFTWPASVSGDFFTSYAAATESAEIATNRLVRALRAIAATPGVGSIDLLAHSRGADLLTSALRQLVLEAVVYGDEPAARFRIGNVVLMAPDVDREVMGQRMQVFTSDPDMLTHWPSQRLPSGISGRLTIYSSPGDKALVASRLIFRSSVRMGQVSADSLDAEFKRDAAKWGRLDVIIHDGDATDRFGHVYFTTNPRVSSDLIQLLRYGKKPGDPGRELEPLGPAVWGLREP